MTVAAQLNSSLLTLSVIAVLIPAAFHFSVHPTSDLGFVPFTFAEEGHILLAVSRGASGLFFVRLSQLTTIH